MAWSMARYTSRVASGRILLVDDDADLRGLFAEYLSDAGYETAQASNGQEALDVLACAVELPDLILLDMLMPVMGGAEFCDRLSKDARLTTLPVVVVAGVQGYQCRGARAFICKPISIDLLLEVVKENCGP